VLHIDVLQDVSQHYESTLCSRRVVSKLTFLCTNFYMDWLCYTEAVVMILVDRLPFRDGFEYQCPDLHESCVPRKRENCVLFLI